MRAGPGRYQSRTRVSSPNRRMSDRPELACAVMWHSRVGIGLLAAAGLFVAPVGAGASSSLYRGPGPRPGPAILYRKPASSPQLSNHGVWHAKPILVSGTSAYRDGEF